MIIEMAIARMKKILFFFSVFCLVIALIIGWWERYNRMLDQKHCYANMRVISAMIETYNRDRKPEQTLKELTPATVELLLTHVRTSMDKSEQRAEPADFFICPADPLNRYYSNGDLSAGGTILCTEHGPQKN